MTEPALPSAPPQRQEASRALQNGVKLGTSLLFTWGIALAVRFWMPRHLGPDLYGSINFAEAFTTTAFVALSLGIDTYVRKEISVRPGHATDFFATTVLLRLALTVLLFGAMELVLRGTHRSHEMRLLVYAFGAALLFVSLNATLSAILHSAGEVDGISVLSVVTKVVWAAGISGALLSGAALVWVPLSLLVSEAIKASALFVLCRRHVGLKLRLDLRVTFATLLASSAFMVNDIAVGAYYKLDAAMLGMLSNDSEVGYYGAATSVAGLALMASPLIGWVLMPVLARAAARSSDELYALARRLLELLLAAAFPVSLGLALGAEPFVQLLFGAPFLPAVPALRILAPMFVLTYSAIACSVTLNLENRGWTVTAISLAGLGANAVLNRLFIPFFLARLGAGGGGVGSAVALILSELIVAGAMLIAMGRRAVGARLVSMLLRTALCCLLVVAADAAMAGAGLGALRLVPDAALYLALVLGTGAVRRDEIAAIVALARRREDLPLAIPAP
jgi:O-antigen/teichoic acid export membrane protein